MIFDLEGKYDGRSEKEIPFSLYDDDCGSVI